MPTGPSPSGLIVDLVGVDDLGPSGKELEAWVKRVTAGAPRTALLCDRASVRGLLLRTLHRLGAAETAVTRTEEQANAWLSDSRSRREQASEDTRSALDDIYSILQRLGSGG